MNFQARKVAELINKSKQGRRRWVVTNESGGVIGVQAEFSDLIAIFKTFDWCIDSYLVGERFYSENKEQSFKGLERGKAFFCSYCFSLSSFGKDS